MTRDPVTGQKLDGRYQDAIVDGPSWERLCDGLKYQGIRDHVEVEFTYVDVQTLIERKVRGRVCSIEGDPGSPSTNPLVKFIPETDCSTYPEPREVSYWPNRRQGHMTNIQLKAALPQPAP